MTSPPTVWYRKDVEGLVFPILRRSRHEGGVPCDVSPRATPPPEDSTTTAILLIGAERVERRPRYLTGAENGRAVFLAEEGFNKIKILLNRVEGNYCEIDIMSRQAQRRRAYVRHAGFLISTHAPLTERDCCADIFKCLAQQHISIHAPIVARCPPWTAKTVNVWK